jgi:hypothetical protein
LSVPEEDRPNPERVSSIILLELCLLHVVNLSSPACSQQILEDYFEDPDNVAPRVEEFTHIADKLLTEFEAACGNCCSRSIEKVANFAKHVGDDELVFFAHIRVNRGDREGAEFYS